MKKDAYNNIKEEDGSQTDDVIEPDELKEETENRPKLKDLPISVYDPYQKYISELRSIPVLSRDEEYELAVKYYEKGDMDAAYKLIVSNLRLVIKISMEFHRNWMKNMSDIIQEGNIGLMEALKRYDPYKNVRFSSYSSYWIRAYIIKFIMENYSLIRIGKTQAQRKLFFKLNKEKRKLEKLGYSVGPKLLAEKLDVKEKDIIEMEQRLGIPILSLDEPIKEDSGTKHLDTLSYSSEETLDDQIAEKEIQDLLKEHLNTFKNSLNENERFIFENRIYTETPLNLRELGEELDFSRERARQIEGKVLKKLKKFLEEHMPEVSI